MERTWFSKEERSDVSINPLFLLPLALAIAGCSGQLAQKANPNPKATAQQAQTPVDATAIVVIPNPYDDDETVATKAADEARQELTKRGYHVVDSEADAKLVAVPTVETNIGTLVKRSSERPLEMFSDTNLSQMDRTSSVSNSLGSLGQVSSGGPIGVVGRAKDELVIEAFPKDAWDHALIVNELQLQPAWKVRMPLPVDLKPIEGEKLAHTDNHPAKTADTDFQLPH
jgi:hypothetical protein